MTPKAKRQIVAKIQLVAKKAMSAQAPDDEFSRLLIFGGDKGAFVLVNDAAATYEELYKRLVQDEGWGEKFSEGHVDRQLRDIIRKLISEHSTKNAAIYFKELVAVYENYAQEHLVYVLLAGIRIHEDPFPLGRVTLRRLSDKLLDEIISNGEAVLMQSLNTREEKVSVAATQRHLLESLKGKGLTCAEYRVVAEPERAKERAEEEARRVLDVLRFSIPVLYPDGYRVGVGLVGDLGRTLRLTPVMSTDATFFQLSSQWVGPLALLELSPEHIAAMREIGALDLAKLLEKDRKDLTSFEAVLLRALHWFANAQTQREPENELLSLMTCLETFFTREPGEPIADGVAWGVAVVCSDDFQTQDYLYRRVKSLYDKRSRVSHGGTKTILSRDLKDLERLAGEVIARLAQRKAEFQGKDGKKMLQEWVTSQHPGAPG